MNSRPCTVIQAVLTAKAYESHDESLLKRAQKSQGMQYKPQSVAPSHGQSQFRPPPFNQRNSSLIASSMSSNQKPRTKKVFSDKEVEDRRANGLCFYCDEKYSPTHNCPRKKLFSMEIRMIEGENIQDVSKEAWVTPDLEEQPKLLQMSIHAVTGEKACETLKVTGYVGKTPILILVDSGSSHNFLDEKLAKELKCSTSSVKPFSVVVANRDKIGGMQKCPNFKWKMQGNSFSSDVLLLPLSEFDLILGVQWLETIKGVTWDYEERNLQFEINGKKVVLSASPKAEIKWVTGEKLRNIMRKEEQFEKSRFFLVLPVAVQPREAEEITCQMLTTVNNNSEMQSLLSEFVDVFAEPTALPPVREYDHQITLRTGIEPVNFRPYRYPAIQKDVMEQLVNEMLVAGVIQNSTSPFSLL